MGAETGYENLRVTCFTRKQVGGDDGRVEIGIRELHPAEIKVRSRTWGAHRAIYEKLRDIVNDPESPGKIKAIATFNIDPARGISEKGKAATLRGNICRVFGTTPEVAGFKFLVVRNIQQTEEYLAVIYQPDKLVEGAYQAHLERQKTKSRRAS